VIREAIQLLFSSPRQEGPFDSVLSARIGRWIADFEEDGPFLATWQEHLGKKQLTVPEENRVQLISMDSHIPERYMKVKCQRVLAGADGTKEEREIVIPC
jgi:hypothetical protein